MKKTDLTPPARAVLKAYFGFSRNQKLSFNTPSRRSAEAIKALDELIDAGLIKCEPRNKYPDCPLDYSALDGAYEVAQTVTQKDIERGNIPMTVD